MYLKQTHFALAWISGAVFVLISVLLVGWGVSFAYADTLSSENTAARQANDIQQAASSQIPVATVLEAALSDEVSSGNVRAVSDKGDAPKTVVASSPNDTPRADNPVDDERDDSEPASVDSQSASVAQQDSRKDELDTGLKGSADSISGIGDSAGMQTAMGAFHDEEVVDSSSQFSQQPIADGIYVIETAVSDSHVVDVAGGSQTDGTSVQIYEYNGTNAQRWRIVYDKSTGYYSIINIGSGKPLDIAGASVKNGASVQIYASNDTDAQHWIIMETASGYKLVSALRPEFVLDVEGAGCSNETRLQGYQSNDSLAQRFWFLPMSGESLLGSQAVSDGCYTIALSKDTQKMLDIPAASLDSSTGVQVYEANGTMAQKYYFTYNSLGWYTIANVNSGKVLDVRGAGIMPGTQVQQYMANGSLAQQWVVVLNEDGTYSFFSRANGLALDVFAGSTANGASLQVYRSNGTMAQEFILAESLFLSDGLYVIHSLDDDNKVFDVPNASTSDTYIQMYGYNGTFAQKYMVSSVVDNTYTIQAVISGKYLTSSDEGLTQSSLVSNATQHWALSWTGIGLALKNIATDMMVTLPQGALINGMELEMAYCSDVTLQSFRLSSAALIDAGYYTLWSLVGDKVLDVAGGERRNGGNVQIYSPNGTASQVFYIEQRGLYYQIASAPSGRVLDVANGSVSNGANVQIYSRNGTNAQLWNVELDAAGNIVFINAGSGKVLDVRGGVDADNSNVDIYTRNGTDAQKWRIVRASYAQDSVVVLAVPCAWNQYDVGLPTGCESMALTNVLLYWGYSLSPTTIADNYMPWSNSDFVYSFLGNPHTYNGGTILAPGLTNAANSFLSSAGSILHAYDISGLSFDALYNYVNEGYPVIVWNTVNMADPGTGWSSGSYTMYQRTHTVVLSGYNKVDGTIYVSDSISGAIWRDVGAFASIYSQMGYQAVVIT